MVAVSKGFIDIITALHVCPLIDINHQDNDGNTALMIAAQAGACASQSISSGSVEHIYAINTISVLIQASSTS